MQERITELVEKAERSPSGAAERHDNIQLQKRLDAALQAGEDQKKGLLRRAEVAAQLEEEAEQLRVELALRGARGGAAEARVGAAKGEEASRRGARTPERGEDRVDRLSRAREEPVQVTARQTELNAPLNVRH